MGIYRFLLPGLYLVRSRLRSRVDRISWVLVNPVVIITMAAAVTDLPLGIFLAALVLSFSAWQSVYETGYLENDLITIQYERSPTLRLDRALRAALVRGYWRLVFGKVLVAVGACGGLAILGLYAQGTVRPGALIVLLIAARLLFWVHNTVRSRANVITYFLLSTLKYIAIPATFLVGDQWALLVVLVVLLFPLIRTLEHASKVKYGFRRIAAVIGDFDQFRPWYYGALTAAFAAVAAGTPASLVYVGLGLAVYFFVLRLGGFLLRGRLGRKKPVAYEWKD